MKTAIVILCVIGFLAFGVAMGFRWLERDGVFDLEAVRIRGIRSADSSTVCASVAPWFGTSIWKIDGDSLCRTLEAHPGIAAVSMSRVPLHAILLEVELDRPAYVLSESQGLTPVSVTGERLPASFRSDTLPVVEAVSPIDGATAARLGLWLADGGAGEGAALLQYREEGVAVILEGGCRVILGDAGLDERWASFTELCRIAPETAAWSEVDMRYGGQAVLRMGEG